MDWVRDSVFLFNPFSLSSPPSKLLSVPQTVPLTLTLVVSFEPSTSNSWAGQCRAAATRLHIFDYYMYVHEFEVLRESKKYVRLFRSEKKFGVSWEICEQRVDLLNKLLLLCCCVTCTHCYAVVLLAPIVMLLCYLHPLLCCCVTCTHTEHPQEPVQHKTQILFQQVWCLILRAR